MKYKEWLKEWLTYYVKSAVKMKTYEKYSRQVNLYLVPYLGEYELKELSPLSLQKFAVSLSERGLPPNTVNGIITVLQSLLRSAENVGKGDCIFRACQSARPRRDRRKEEGRTVPYR